VGALKNAKFTSEELRLIDKILNGKNIKSVLTQVNV
jgi:hypothetical protein